jgi:four helix bundle protein
LELETRKPAKSFEDLIVWQKAHAFTMEVYAVTRAFPKEEMYGLTSQFRRAAVSIPANIAEGFRKRSDQDKARYANIAEGSLQECRYYLILAHDLGLLDKAGLWESSEQVCRLLSAYRNVVSEAATGRSGR